MFSCHSNLQIPDKGQVVADALSSVSDSGDDKSDCPSSDYLSDECLGGEILAWAKNCNISSVHVGSLLAVLRKYHPTLPKDPRTLLETAREVSVKECGNGGGYYHFGILTVLQNMWHRGLLELCPGDSRIMLQLNIDGLQLFRSSGYQFWPILGSVVNAVHIHVFEIGLYGGCQKPADVNEFLRDLVLEVQQLQCDGIVLGGVNYSISIHSIVCDAPARSYIKCIKPHNSYSSCERCTEEGQWIAGRVTFPSVDKPLRTDDSFKAMTDEDHHTGKSPLECLNIGLVTQLPLDEMHLVYLGTMRRLIMFWLRGPIVHKCRLSGHSVRIISDRLLRLQHYVCSEFARKPRSLSEVDRWKATEFRMFLLYLGPVVLSGVLPTEYYQHFLLLHIAMYCLNSLRLCTSHIDYAKMLLIRFVQDAPSLYGPEFVVYNTHSLIHVCDDACTFGKLHDINAFKYENHMKQLKKLVRHPNNPLKQAVKRILEKQNVQPRDPYVNKDSFVCKKEHSSGPLCSAAADIKQFANLMFNDYKLTRSVKNNCVQFLNGDIGIVRNIVQSHDGEVLVVYQLFGTVDSFFDHPCKSENLGFCLRATNLQTTLLAGKAVDVAAKCLCLPQDTDVFVIFPLCHVG